MADTYWIRNRGRTHGPYTTDQLRQLAARGQFSSAFQISEDGLNWERAAAYPELFVDKASDSKSELDSGVSETGKRQAEDFQLDRSTVPTTGPPSGPQWRYERNGSPSDPVSFDQLQALIARGEVRPDGLVWNETLSSWTRARDVSGLVFPSTVGRSFESPSGAPHQNSGAPEGPAPLSQLAIASFVCGVVGAASPLFIPLGLLAVVFGHVSLYTRRVQSGELRGKGLAIAGLTIGWCCLLILPVMAYFLLAALPSPTI